MYTGLRNVLLNDRFVTTWSMNIVCVYMYVCVVLVVLKIISLVPWSHQQQYHYQHLSSPSLPTSLTPWVLIAKDLPLNMWKTAYWPSHFDWWNAVDCCQCFKPLFYFFFFYLEIDIWSYELNQINKVILANKRFETLMFMNKILK